MTVKRDDTLWKGLIEDLFPEFLEFFFPYEEELHGPGVTFDFLDKELHELYPASGAANSTKIVDKLIRVRLNESEDRWFLVHVEVQEYWDKYFAQRMYEYNCRIRARYGRQVTALAIYTGNWGGHDEYQESFRGTDIIYRFNTFRIRNASIETMILSDNIFGLIVLAVKAAIGNMGLKDPDLLRLYTWIYRALLEKGIPVRKMLGVRAFLENCVQFAEPETYRIFEKQLESITGKNNPMGVIEMLEERGLEKGRAKVLAEGRKEAQEEFVTNLLAKLHLVDEQIADIVGVDLTFVREVKDKIKK